MDIKIQAVLGQNVTLLYDSLDLHAIDSGDLKELRGAQSRPTVMDTPDMIVAMYPPEPIFVQIGDRRIRITAPQRAEGVGDIPLWEIAIKCDQLAPKAKSTLIAYGFNYDIGIELVDGNAHKVTMDVFLSNLEMLNGALEGRLSSFVPRLMFERGQTRYDLVLEPVAERRIKAHLNSHFEFQGIVLPSQDQLKTSLYEEYKYLVSMLPRLFAGAK